MALWIYIRQIQRVSPNKFFKKMKRNKIKITTEQLVWHESTQESPFWNSSLWQFLCSSSGAATCWKLSCSSSQAEAMSVAVELAWLSLHFYPTSLLFVLRRYFEEAERLVWAPVVTRLRWLQICGMPSDESRQLDDKLGLESVKTWDLSLSLNGLCSSRTGGTLVAHSHTMTTMIDTGWWFIYTCGELRLLSNWYVNNCRYTLIMQIICDTSQVELNVESHIMIT
jgi:hypothetical protein